MHVPYTAKCMKSGLDDKAVLIDFSAAIDRVNHRRILYKLFCDYWKFCVVYTDTILSYQSLHVMVKLLDKMVNVVSGVPQDSVLGPLLILLCTLELFSILENKLITYADDSTLIDVMPFPGVSYICRVLSCDLVKVSEWCDLWGMKFNARLRL